MSQGEGHPQHQLTSEFCIAITFDCLYQSPNNLVQGKSYIDTMKHLKGEIIGAGTDKIFDSQSSN